eukprot:IDg18827t1
MELLAALSQVWQNSPVLNAINFAEMSIDAYGYIVLKQRPICEVESKPVLAEIVGSRSVSNRFEATTTRKAVEL